MPIDDIHRPYEPSADTYLLYDFLKQKKISNKRVLEIGAGSGIIAEFLGQNCYVVATDIDLRALRNARAEGRSKVDYLCCDGAQPFRKDIFDFVVFNPPYLPSERIVDKTTDGGPSGIEITEEWLKQSKYVLSHRGLVFFISSSLADLKRLKKSAKTMGLQTRVMKSRPLFFEELYVFSARRRNESRLCRRLQR